MPLLFTRDQIKRHLAELGYENLPEAQLNVFIKDLKKLIKVEEKKHALRKTGIEDESIQSIYTSTTAGPDQTATSFSSGRPEDQYDAWQHSDSDEGDLGRSQDENYKPTPDITKEKPRPTTAPATRTRTASTMTLLPKNSLKPPSEVDEKSKSRRPLTARPSTRESSGPASYSGSSSHSTSSSLYGFEFGSPPPECDDDVRAAWKTKIKNLPPESVRRDPVALYHYYKSFWDKQRAPGENARMQLRWNVRAGTLGRVPCDPCGNRVKYLREKSVGPNTGNKKTEVSRPGPCSLRC